MNENIIFVVLMNHRTVPHHRQLFMSLCVMYVDPTLEMLYRVTHAHSSDSFTFTSLVSNERLVSRPQ